MTQPGAKEPTDAQKAAGNYQKGHKAHHGLRISIENAAGTVRRGKGEDGQPWESQIKHDYGYIRGTKGKDKDHLDVFLGPHHAESDAKVHVVDQNTDSGKFDEHKVMLGFPDTNSAYEAYHANYPPGHGGFGGITQTDPHEFKRWAFAGKGAKQKRVSDMKMFAKGGSVKPAEQVDFKAPPAVVDVAPSIDAIKIPKLTMPKLGAPKPVKLAKGGKVQGALQCGCGGHAEPAGYAAGGVVLRQLAEDLPKWLKSMGMLDGASGGAPAAKALPGLLNAAPEAPFLNKPPPESVQRLLARVRPLEDLGDADWGATPAKRGGPNVNGFHVAQDLEPILRSGVLDNRLAASNMQGYAPDHVGGGYFYSSPQLARAQRERTLGELGGEPGDLPILGVGLNARRDKFLPDEDTGHKIWTKSYDEGSFATGNPVKFYNTSNIYTGDVPRIKDLIRQVSDQVGIKYADGGSVDEQLTPQQIEAMAAASKPYIGARGPRAEANNDREGAKQLPLGLLRGRVAGTLGFGGDMEGLARTLANMAGANVDSTPVLPTSDFYKDAMPMGVTSAAGKAGDAIGTMTGMPASGVALKGVRALKSITPAVEEFGPALEKIMSSGLGQAIAPGTMRLNAVKPKGGNWLSGGIDDFTDGLSGGVADQAAKAWINKRVPDYVRNHMGTSTDPMLALEQEGRMHLSPEAVATRADDYATMKRSGSDHWVDSTMMQADTKAPDGQFYPVDHDFHTAATGRKGTSDWEALTDSMVNPHKASEYQGSSYALDKPWLNKIAPDSDVYSTSRRSLDKLGFDHIADYLSSAVEASKLHSAGGDLPPNIQQIVARNLHIDPDKLGMMTLPQIAAKTNDWDKMLAETQRIADTNKGIKTVAKTYDDGHSWVELDQNGLEGEGKAMGHCVGGYCSSVEGGDTRIMSLRDKDGQPHVTVELGRPRGQGWGERSQPPADQYDAAKEKWWTGVQDGTYPKDQTFADWYHNTNVSEAPWQINQIKGKGNRKPVDTYIPAVQDLVKNMGPWDKDIRDFHNTGLVNTSGRQTLHKHAFDVRPDLLPDARDEAITQLQGLNLPKYMSEQELKAALDRVAPYRPPAGARYAQGGAVGTATVGNATFGGADQPQIPTAAANSATGWGSGFTGSATPAVGSIASALPQGKATAPAFNVNDPAGRGFLNMTLQAGGAGTATDRGVAAFMPKNWGLTDQVAKPGMSGGMDQDVSYDSSRAAGQIADLAKRIGFDTSKYDLSNTNGLNEADYGGRDIARGLNSSAAQSQGGNGVAALYQALNRPDALGGYQRIGGMSAGWDGHPVGDRSASDTMYKIGEDGSYTPQGASGHYRVAENPGWVRGEGADFVQAMSTMLPAVGGWAGLANSAGLGATAAGLEAGSLGATALNAGINAVGNGLLSGNPTGALTGALGSVAGGYLGSAAGGYLGQGYAQLGQQLGSKLGAKAASYLTQKS